MLGTGERSDVEEPPRTESLVGIHLTEEEVHGLRESEMGW